MRACRIQRKNSDFSQKNPICDQSVTPPAVKTPVNDNWEIHRTAAGEGPAARSCALGRSLRTWKNAARYKAALFGFIEEKMDIAILDLGSTCFWDHQVRVPGTLLQTKSESYMGVLRA
jgi:hypothetical protein